VQKISSFEVVMAIAQSRSRQVPHVQRPQTQRENRPMCA
jgi:hypothetical protein